MNTQTERPVRRPPAPRGKGSRNRRYSKQTAHVEARRDGRPLIFGWGKHLSHNDKVRIQRRATWGLAAIIVLLLVGVVVGSWININIVVPGETIASVNGHTIPQSEYRMMVAVETQFELNKLYGPNGLTNQLTSLQKQNAALNTTITQYQSKISSLESQIKKLPSGPSAQRTSLNNQLKADQKSQATAQASSQNLQNQINTLNNNTIVNEKTNFTQSQVGNESIGWLLDDEVIREWLTTQSASIQAKINPTQTQLNNDLKSLKANMPTSNGYNTFLGQMGIGNQDILSMLTILDRRANLQTYLAQFIVTPSYQVQASQMTLPTKAKAQTMLQDLQKNQSFATLAKANSQDSATKTKGGDLGWLTHYQYIDASSGGPGGPSVVDNWLFDPSRTVNDISPILFGNGAYYIVQVTSINKAKAVTSTILQALKANALVDWLQDREALPIIKLVAGNQTMMFDANNLPPNNILPASAPALTPTAAVPVQ